MNDAANETRPSFTPEQLSLVPKTLTDVRVEKTKTGPHVVGLPSLEVVGVDVNRRGWNDRGDWQLGFAVRDTFAFKTGWLACGKKLSEVEVGLRDWIARTANRIGRRGLDPRSREEYIARIQNWPADVAELLWNVWSTTNKIDAVLKARDVEAS